MSRPSPRRSMRPAAGLLLVLLTLAATLVPLRAQEVAPAALDEAVAAGPWEMRLLEAQTGRDAAATLAEASSANPTSPGDGLQFVAARLRVRNVSQTPYGIQPDDFAGVAADGIVRRSAVPFPPEPALAGRLGAGDEVEGWVVAVAPAGDDEIVLRYDSASISGTWADRDFALTEGATLRGDAGRVEAANRIGRRGDPVGVDEVVATREWAVSLQEVVLGTAVYDISPPETQRLADSYRAGTSAVCLETWVALRFRIANNGGDGRARYLSPTAFRLADGEGRPLDDVRLLTPPRPDAAGEYLPGAERSGWVSFEIPSACDGDATNLLTDSSVIRFLPFSDSRDARYFDWSGGGSSTEEAPLEVADLAEGDRARVSEDGVNLREAPSIEAVVVAVLVNGEVVVVTGPAEEADGVTWYPVAVEETGETGFVSGAYLEALA